MCSKNNGDDDQKNLSRVPIIKFLSTLGVEVDISIGGLNGADTSLYAATQAKRYVRYVVSRRMTNEISYSHEFDVFANACST